MNLQEKYEKLGWKFDVGPRPYTCNDELVLYARSPRTHSSFEVKHSDTTIPSLLGVKEEELLRLEAKKVAKELLKRDSLREELTQAILSGKTEITIKIP